MSVSLPPAFKKSGYVVMARRVEGDNFTILDRKIFHILLASAYPNILKKRIHQILVHDLAVLVSESGIPETTRKIQESLERLWKHRIAIDYVDEDQNESVIRCNYLSFEMSKMDGGVLNYSFDDIMLKFLSEPRIYSFVRFNVTDNLKRNESMKLYEVMQMTYMTYQKQVTLSVDEIREFLEVDDLYEGRWDHFRSRCLEPAIREVNEFAQFNVECEYVRSGKGGKVQSVVLTPVGKVTTPKIAVTSTPKGRKGPGRVDARTPDFFNGVSDVDMSMPPPLRPETLEEASTFLGDTHPAEEVVQKWFSQMGEKCFDRPDEKFLAFVRTMYRAETSRSLKGVDVDDLFDDLYAD